MAQIQTAGPSGQTLYALLIDGIGNFYNTGTPAYEAWTLGNYASYGVALTEQSSSGIYLATIPAGAVTTLESYVVKAMLGSAFAQSDTVLGIGPLSTNGALEGRGYTATRAGFLDTLNGLVAAIWASATRTLSAFGFSVTAATVSDKTGYALTTAEHTLISGTDVPAGLVTGHLTTARADKLDNLDAAISTRLATGGYTAPDNSDIVAALNDLVTLLARTDPTTALAAIKTVTDQFRFTIAHEVDANALTGGGGSITVAEIWDYLTSNLTTPSSIGQFILAKLGLISAETVIVPGITLPASKEFCLLRGDMVILSFNCVNSVGTAYDLTSSDLLFLTKNDEGDADADAVITKASGAITITDAVAGQCTVMLAGADTTGLQTGTYWWGIKDLVQDKTVTRGTIVLQAEPVKAISA